MTGKVGKFHCGSAMQVIDRMSIGLPLWISADIGNGTLRRSAYYFVRGGFGMLMAKRRSQDSTSHLEIDWASSRSANGTNALLAGLSRYRT